MILELKFKNFRSAKDWQILSFEASSDKVSEEYYCTTINDTKVLKLGILYGANASGKTNVLLALDFLRRMAISPKINKTQPIGFIPFLLDDATKQGSGVFELTFFVGDVKHLYAIEIDNSAVLKETLKYYPGKQPAEVFSRETINGITHIQLGSKIRLNAAEQEKLQVNTLSNMSVVSAYATANFMFPELERVYNYFLKQWLPILLPQTDLQTWATGEVENGKEDKAVLLDLLHRADFNISGFDVQQNENSRKGSDLIFEHTISVDGKNSVHYLPDVLESAGTIRYYGLGTILNTLLEKNAIIPVDELENSLHPDLFAHFINLFLVNSTRSQLIFSTHNLQSLDTEDLRKDVVWFTEKRDDGSTELFSLDDFNIRNGVSFLNAYNAGKFGAKPTLGSIFIPKKQ
jgi:AAA15 family ATPase/GTPase